MCCDDAPWKFDRTFKYYALCALHVNGEIFIKNQEKYKNRELI